MNAASGVRRFFSAVWLVALVAACGVEESGSSEPDAGTPSTARSGSSTEVVTTSTSPDDQIPPVDDPAVDAAAGVATWPLVDQVPAFRKAGINVIAGLDYEPLLDDFGAQRSVRLSMNAVRGLFAMVPFAIDYSADHIQLGGIEGVAELWPFVIFEDGELRVFVDPDAPGDCSEVVVAGQPFEAFGVVDDVDGGFAVSTGSCVAYREDDGLILGAFDGRTGVRAFGALVSAGQTDAVVGVSWLALSDGSEPAVGAPIQVELVGREHLISDRTTDPSDDSAVDVLHVLRADGTRLELPVNEDGGWTVQRQTLGDRAKLWIEDYGSEFYVRQGPWLDLGRLTSDLTIDVTPEFVPTGVSPESSDNHRRPHQLSWWNGSRAMPSQEFAGRNWNNNLGFLDRDRSLDNQNACTRVAWLGGSYVAAAQTRVDQKPALIAEALLDVQSDSCFEVFSLGQNVFTVENHAGNARQLVEEFGVTQLIFSISDIELCRMNDDVYSFGHGVAADTPVHWRFLDGEFVTPVSRREAQSVDVADGFTIRQVCQFDRESPSFSGAQDVVAKLGLMADAMETWGEGVEVTFLVMRNVLEAESDIAALISELCLATGHDCLQLSPLAFREKPGELRAVDFNPYLSRYAGDGHPNAMANQHIARGIVEAVLGGGGDTDPD